MSPRRSLLATFLICLSLLSSGRANALTAYRITDLDLRDPHVYMSFIFCTDVTDNQLAGFSVNSQLQTQIQTDGDGDGLLDVNLLIVLDDLDPNTAGGTFTLINGLCTAPMATTSCVPSTTVPYITSYLDDAASPCLGPILGTTYGPYTPEITSASTPCFVSGEFSGVLPLFAGAMPVSMSHMQVAATYGPSGALVNGLIRGFVSEADANNTILPATIPIVGGQPFSYILPGGDPPGPSNTNCASHSDKDFVEGVPGWWFYYNFTAQAVPYQSATGVDAPVARGVAIFYAVPNPFNPSTTIRYTIDTDAFVSVLIYEASGRFVADLVHEQQSPGDHEVRWNGTTSTGSTASSGVYFVRLESNGKTATRKIVLLK